MFLLQASKICHEYTLIYSKLTTKVIFVPPCFMMEKRQNFTRYLLNLTMVSGTFPFFGGLEGHQAGGSGDALRSVLVWCPGAPEMAISHFGRCCSYGHLLVITGYNWDYTFYKWGFVSTYNWYFGP